MVWLTIDTITLLGFSGNESCEVVHVIIYIILHGGWQTPLSLPAFCLAQLPGRC